MSYLGDFLEDATVRFLFTTHDSSGGAVAPSTAFEAADLIIYKDGSATQKTTTNGVTMTSPFDSVTGLHLVEIDTSNDTGDAGFWTTGSDYSVILSPDETVDSQTVVRTVAQFGIENRVESAVYSDTTAIHSQTTVIESNSIVIESDTAAIHSQTTVIESDSTKIESDATAIHSDTTIIASDIVIVVSDTTAIHSQTTVVESDAAVIESDTTRLELSIIVATGALEGTPSSTVLQTDLSETTNDHYNNMVFVMTSGDEAGEARRISDYTGATGTVTLQTALSGAPSSTETFAILAIPSYEDAIYSDTTIVVSDVAVIESDTTAIHSQTTVIESDSVKIESDTAVIESDTTAIHSDTTIIASDVVIIVSDTTAIHSQTTVVESDTTAIHSDTTIIASDVVQVYSDTTIIASDIVIVVSDTTAIHSQTTVIESDTTVIESDTTVVEAGVDVTSIGGSANAATQLSAHAVAVLRLAVDAGSSTTTIVFKTVDGGSASSVDDFYNGRVVVFTSGALAGQATDITDYTGSTVTATVTAMTGTPAEDVTAVIV